MWGNPYYGNSADTYTDRGLTPSPDAKANGGLPSHSKRDLLFLMWHGLVSHVKLTTPSGQTNVHIQSICKEKKVNQVCSLVK